MRRLVKAAIAVAILGAFACGIGLHSRAAAQAGSWISLFDGKTMNMFTPVGDANWKVANGELAADTGTGAIVNAAKVVPMPKAGGKWNTYEITAKGGRFTVTLNGQKTVDNVEDTKFAKGPVALQRFTGSSKEPDIGVIKFRKVDIRPL